MFTTLLIIFLKLYSSAIFIYFLTLLLVNLRILNSSHGLIMRILSYLQPFIEPALRSIRRFVPLIKGVDISPIILGIAVEISLKLLMI